MIDIDDLIRMSGTHDHNPREKSPRLRAFLCLAGYKVEEFDRLPYTFKRAAEGVVVGVITTQLCHQLELTNDVLNGETRLQEDQSARLRRFLDVHETDIQEGIELLKAEVDQIRLVPSYVERALQFAAAIGAWNSLNPDQQALVQAVLREAVEDPLTLSALTSDTNKWLTGLLTRSNPKPN